MFARLPFAYFMPHNDSGRRSVLPLSRPKPESGRDILTLYRAAY